MFGRGVCSEDFPSESGGYKAKVGGIILKAPITERSAGGIGQDRVKTSDKPHHFLLKQVSCLRQFLFLPHSKPEFCHRK